MGKNSVILTPTRRARIDLNGSLQIQRSGRLKTQYCVKEADVYCGDWCPIFYDDIGNNIIGLCHNRTWLFKSILDLREIE